MCAWWAGQPVWGSREDSKYVRENLLYLKDFTDIISGSGVSLADLQKLIAITADVDELNIMAGALVSLAEINALAGSGITLADLQRLAAVTSSASELNILDGCNVGSATQLNRTVNYPAFGSTTITSSANKTITTGFYPRFVLFLSGGGANICVGIDNGTSSYRVSINSGFVQQIATGASIYAWASAGNTISGYITQMLSTGFVIDPTETGACTATIYYVAFP